MFEYQEEINGISILSNNCFQDKFDLTKRNNFELPALREKISANFKKILDGNLPEQKERTITERCFENSNFKMSSHYETIFVPIKTEPGNVYEAFIDPLYESGRNITNDHINEKNMPPENFYISTPNKIIYDKVQSNLQSKRLNGESSKDNLGALFDKINNDTLEDRDLENASKDNLQEMLIRSREIKTESLDVTEQNEDPLFLYNHHHEQITDKISHFLTCTNKSDFPAQNKDPNNGLIEYHQDKQTNVHEVIKLNKIISENFRKIIMPYLYRGEELGKNNVNAGNNLHRKINNIKEADIPRYPKRNRNTTVLYMPRGTVYKKRLKISGEKYQNKSLFNEHQKKLNQQVKLIETNLFFNKIKPCTLRRNINKKMHDLITGRLCGRKKKKPETLHLK